MFTTKDSKQGLHGRKNEHKLKALVKKFTSDKKKNCIKKSDWNEKLSLVFYMLPNPWLIQNATPKPHF